MSALTKYLRDLILQLEQRKMMIPRYVKKPGSFLGRTDFSLNDLPVIDKQISEAKAALKGIEIWESNKSELLKISKAKKEQKDFPQRGRQSRESM